MKISYRYFKKQAIGISLPTVIVGLDPTISHVAEPIYYAKGSCLCRDDGVKVDSFTSLLDYFYI
ncbi:MAG: hypothetical protein KGV56_05445 [Gammaproteobacteria bacterium]|nr:hypothetical protein [Gammaproteobacteria bacterium]